MLPSPARPYEAPLAAEHKSRQRVWLVAAVLVLATVAAYHRTFSAPFVFDDVSSIPLNSTIRGFGTALFPPNTNGETVSGRPLVNLTLALNYAISGNRVWSYHALNLLIHICAGLALFGLARRTLLRGTGCQPVSGKHGLAAHATPLAATIAALWLLHPLQTESVTYIVQRAESLMALLYLLTLYLFVRAVAPSNSALRTPHSAFFLALSVLTCLLGMAAKEVMVSAPLIVLLYDRAFISGTFREALTRRPAYYAALAATWLLLALILIPILANNRGNTAGFGVAEVSPWTYLLTQAQAIPRYLRLALWPAGLTFDYGIATVTTLAAVWPQALFMLALLLATIWANIRHPKIGLPAALFFAVLAPSSSIIPIATQTMAEHRMYLPLAAVITTIVLAVWYLVAEKRASASADATQSRPLGFGISGFGIFLGFGILGFGILLPLTLTRNETYRTPLALWQDTVAKAPDNTRAHSNLAAAYISADKDYDLAVQHSLTAIRLKSDYYQAYNNLGYAYYKLGRYDDALAIYKIALLSKAPGVEVAHNNRGVLLYKLARYADSLADFQQAIALQPLYTEAYSNMGNTLFALRRPDEALRALDTALAQDPDYPAAWNNRGNIYAGLGADMDEALRCYKHAAELDPKKWDYLDNNARLLLQLGRAAESLPYWRRALPLAPDPYKARYGLGNALMLSGRIAESIPEYEAAIASNPNMAGAQINLGVALTQTGRPAEAPRYFEAALRIAPWQAQAPIHHAYAAALAALGRVDDAIAREQEALRIDPDFAPSREQLQILQREKTNLNALPPPHPRAAISKN